MMSITFNVPALCLNRRVREELERIFKRRFSELSDEEKAIGVACMAALGRLGG